MSHPIYKQTGLRGKYMTPITEQPIRGVKTSKVTRCDECFVQYLPYTYTDNGRYLCHDCAKKNRVI